MIEFPEFLPGKDERTLLWFIHLISFKIVLALVWNNSRNISWMNTPSSGSRVLQTVAKPAWQFGHAVQILNYHSFL